MILPTFDECNAALALKGEMTPLQAFVYDNEPQPPHDTAWRLQLQAALDDVLMPRLKKGSDGTAPVATKKSAAVPRVRFSPDHDPIVEGPGSPIPVPAAAPPAGKTFKGTGKHYKDDADNWIEIGTWINPAGDIEAARLTKETGIPHVVDPRSGDVIVAGGGTVQLEAPVLADPGSVVPGNFTAAMFDHRPRLADQKSFKP